MPKRLTTLYPFSALLVGLVLTQILATAQVYVSNTTLYDSLVAIKNAGYLAIPNPQVMGSLREIGPAFFGGLFFTFSIGAGISFFTLALAWVWNRIFYRNKYLLWSYLFIWVGSLISLNLHGVKLFLTSIVLIIPPAVFALVSKSLVSLSQQNRRPNDIIHIIPVVLLALVLAWQIDGRMFTDFRDIYLLSNPIGAKINNFYYKYTLYPAEVFKSLNQKMLKTGATKSETDTKGNALEAILLNYDYIPVDDQMDVDLKILSNEDDVSLENRGNPVLRISSEAFFADPDKAIRAFEKKSDTDSLLRQLTFLSLLFGFPLAIYVLAHGLIGLLVGFFISPRKAALTASALCFIVCITMMFVFQLNRGRDISAQNLLEALSSKHWQTRVAALKFIDEKGLEISRFKSYPDLLASAHIAERYWLAKTLGNSENRATYDALINFLKDPSPNVVTMALYAIGKRGNRDVVDKILQLIETTDSWYIQWYAYKALRSIGWRQSKSKQAP
ncbi:MAG: HEAT repeat domain-containing protein [Desulfobacterales bacterium]|jgi:hypothetical protein